MQKELEISAILGELGELVPTGYAIALHINFTTPKFLFQTYPKNWIEYYQQKGLLMVDPTVVWGFDNHGYTRWSALDDPNNVLVQSADFGLKYGASCAIQTDDGDSFGSFANSQREFTDAEIEVLANKCDQLHHATADKAQLSPDTIQQLRNMSIMVTRPGA